MSRRRVQVHASPGWEVDVDPEWAEGLFAVFLRHAKHKPDTDPGKPKKRRLATDDTDVIVLEVEEEQAEHVRRARRARQDTVEVPQAPPAEPATSTPPPSDASVREKTTDEAMSAVALAEFLGEMATLVKYGHSDQVTGEVRRVFQGYPRDLLLRRRVIDFLIDCKLVVLATDELYGLGAALLEGGDVEGVREIVSKVRSLEPDSPRTRRLMKLVAQRRRTSPGRR